MGQTTLGPEECDGMNTFILKATGISVFHDQLLILKRSLGCHAENRSEELRENQWVIQEKIYNNPKKKKKEGDVELRLEVEIGWGHGEK